MTINMRNGSKEMNTVGTYKYGTYFKLSDNDRKRDDEISEEVCLTIQFLSRSSNKIHR